MKYLKGFRFLVFGLLVVLISCTGQQKKKHAEKEFCDKANYFMDALVDLDKANQGTDEAAFNKAYKKADRDWNRLVDAADKLENVEINESVKSYNKLVNKINKIAADTDITDEDATYQINQQIGATSDKINDLLTTECK